MPFIFGRGRAWRCDRLVRRLMFVRYQYGSYPVTEQRIRPTHYTNTHTGDVLNDPARDLSETRREYQCEPNGKSHCVQQVLQQVNEEVRPQLRDGRNKERPPWSLGRYPWHIDHVKPSKSQTIAALTTAIVGRCTAALILRAHAC